MAVAVKDRLPARRRAKGDPAAHIALAIVLPSILVIGVFATPFIRDRSTLPLGFDTSGYVWRTSVAQTEGLSALAAERPGHPIVTAFLGSISGADPLTGAWIAPGVMAAAIALAAGTVAVDCLSGRRRYALPAAVGLGASAYVSWTALGFAANLMFDVVAVALVAVTIRAMLGSRGVVVSSVVLLAGGAAIHWMFAAVFAALLALAIGVFAITGRLGVRGARRSGLSAAALGAGCLGAVVALLLAPDLPDHLPRIDLMHVAAFTSKRLASFGLPVVVPLAVAAIIVGARRRERRWGVTLLAAWASLAVASIIAWSALELPTPPYRWTGFALGLPLLAALAGPWLAEIVSTLGKWGPAAAVVLALAPASWLAVEGAQVWWSQEPLLSQEAFVELGTVSSYLARDVPADSPIVISVRPTQEFDSLSRVRAGLPAPRALDASILRIDYTTGGLLPTAPPGAVVLHLSAFRPGPPPDGTQLGPGVWLLQGPAPTTPVPVGQTRSAPDALHFVGLSFAWLVILALAGSGFGAMLDISVIGRVGLTPAFGIAAVVVAGEVASHVGVRPGGWGAVAILGVTTFSGWALVPIVFHHGDRRPVADAPGDETPLI